MTNPPLLRRFAATAFCVAIAGSTLAQTEVYPGVYRVRVGTPEKFTPVGMRVAPVSTQLKRFDHAPAPVAGVAVKWQASGDGVDIQFPTHRSEQFYGLGLNTTLFRLNGKEPWSIPSDNPEAVTNESHAPEPFFVSTKGYGVYIDTARFVHYSFATTGGVSAHVPHVKGVDIYVFAGPTALDAVRRYNLFSGGGCVPPLWGLGMAYRGQSNFTADQAIALAKSFRDTNMPCDIFGIEPGWQTKTYSSSFVWNSPAFPNPDEFIKSMHNLDYHLSFWEHPFTNPVSPMYDALKPYSGDHLVWSGLVPDFATEGGRRVYVGRQEEVLFSKGVDSIKLDEIDHQPFSKDRWSYPDDSKFPSGLDGEQMHTMIGVLAADALMKPFRDRNVRTWGLERESGPMAASLPYTIYSDSYTAENYIRGMAKIGFGGHMWVPEVRDAKSPEELIRRIQTVIFSPYAMINCWYMKTPPWRQINADLGGKGIEMPQANATTDRVRKLFELRMSLVPYLYSAFNEYRNSGTPVVRALVLDFPGDRQTETIDNQFMVGPSLMVAPLMDTATKRSVYFPTGDWYELFTGKKITGGQTLQIDCSIDEVPIYVKANSLIPMAKPVQHIGHDTVFGIEVGAFGPKPAPFTLYEDDGASLDYLRGAQNRLVLSWPNRVKRTGKFVGKRYEVIGWKRVSQ